MAALTLLEASKIHSGDVYRQGIIETIGTYGSILSVVPFMTIGGSAYVYNQEGSLPSVGFRGINENYESTVGEVSRKTEALTVFGGDITVDAALLKLHGEDQQDIQESMQLKAMVLDWGRAFIKGDSVTNVKEFDGLQVRLTGDQVITNGAGSSGGDPLSLASLDEAIDAVDTPTHIVMNRTMGRRLSAAARNQDVSGFVTWESNQDMGTRVMFYNDLPVVLIDEDAEKNQILDFSEANPGGGAAASTSIYVISFGDGQCVGLENGGVEVRDQGLVGNQFITSIEWLQSFALLSDKSAARLNGITNAPATA